MQTDEEYLDSLLASVSKDENNDNADNETSDSMQTEVKSQSEFPQVGGREILTEDSVELLPEDLEALQSMIDDVVEYSVEPKEESEEDSSEQDSAEPKEESEEDSSEQDSVNDTSESEETDEQFESEAVDNSDETVDDSMDEIMEMLGLSHESESEAADMENIEELLLEAEKKGKDSGTGETAVQENQDLSDILGILGNDDHDLAEIGDILQKSDQNEPVADDMLSMLTGNEIEEGAQGMFDNSLIDRDEVNMNQDSFGDDTSTEDTEQQGKKKRKKREKKSKRKVTPELTEEEEMANLLEEAEPTESGDSSKAKKNRKSRKKGQKAASDTDVKDANTALEEEMEREDKTDSKKLEKERRKREKEAARQARKKEAAKKREEKYAYLDQGRKISNGGIIAVFAICFSLAAILILLIIFIPAINNQKKARESFYRQDYQDTVTRLYGKKMNESDRLMYEKAVLFYGITSRFDAYRTYIKMNDAKSALDALLQAAKECAATERQATNFGMSEEWNLICTEIYSELLTTYHLSNADVNDIIQMKDLEYTYTVEAILAGDGYQSEQAVSEPTEEATDTSEEELPDLLPEERELQTSETKQPDDVDVDSNGEEETILHTGVVEDGEAILTQ